MKYVFEVLEEVQKAKTKPEKVAILKKNETWALKDVLRGSIDPVIKWHFPKGEVPYTPSEAHNHPTNLLRENKKFIYFAVGGKGDNLPAFKRERLFLGILESVHPKDAELLVDMINKKAPKGVTKAIVKEAFPGLIRE
jgi:hypothetical protein